MTFQQLQYLLEVKKTSSIAQAAKNLYVTSSSVSIAINALEKELGYPIFVRTSKGMFPTPQGNVVIEYAGRINETYQLINNIDHKKTRQVRLSSVSYEPSNIAFARLVEECKDMTDITFSLSSHSADVMMKKLQFFEIDCGIIYNFEPRIRILEQKLKRMNLHWKPLDSIPVYITIGPGHRLYQQQSVTLSDLENDYLVDAPGRGIERSDFLRGLMTIDPNRLITANSSAQNHLIHKGLAYAISRKRSADDIEKYQLRSIPIDGVTYRLMSITNPMQELSAETKRFLELLEEEIGKEY